MSDLIARLTAHDRLTHWGDVLVLLADAAAALRQKEAEIVRITKERNNWEADARASMANWHAACAELSALRDQQPVARECTQAQVNAFITAWASVRPLMEDNPYYTLECAQAIWRAMYDAAHPSCVSPDKPQQQSAKDAHSSCVASDQSKRGADSHEPAGDQ